MLPQKETAAAVAVAPTRRAAVACSSSPALHPLSIEELTATCSAAAEAQRTSPGNPSVRRPASSVTSSIVQTSQTLYKLPRTQYGNPSVPTAKWLGSSRGDVKPPSSQTANSQDAIAPAAMPILVFAALTTEHEKVKRQVQYWFRLKSLEHVDWALGPDTQTLAIAGDAVLKFQVVNRLFKSACYTTSARRLHEESLKYITNEQLACVVAWKLDLHKLLRLHNFTRTNPSKIAIKKLGTAVEALLGVVALQQAGEVERVVRQIFSMIGSDTAVLEGRSAVPMPLLLH